MVLDDTVSLKPTHWSSVVAELDGSVMDFNDHPMDLFTRKPVLISLVVGPSFSPQLYKLRTNIASHKINNIYFIVFMIISF